MFKYLCWRIKYILWPCVLLTKFLVEQGNYRFTHFGMQQQFFAKVKMKIIFDKQKKFRLLNLQLF